MVVSPAYMLNATKGTDCQTISRITTKKVEYWSLIQL